MDFVLCDFLIVIFIFCAIYPQDEHALLFVCDGFLFFILISFVMLYFVF